MRVAVFGPQNTGKSTFIQDFIQEFHHYKTPSETYRDVIENNQLEINQKTGLESQKAIRDFMFGQLRHNTEYNIIFDRCLIDNFMYTSVAYEAGNIPKWFVDETYAMMIDTLQSVDMYLFIPTSVSIPLVEDGTRDVTKSYIDTVNTQFLKIIFDLIRTHHITVKVISGTRKERIDQVKKII
jgi:nicotinamide riboside kinase